MRCAAFAHIGKREDIFMSDGKKINMTVVYPDSECCAEVLIADNGFVVGKEETGYDDYEKAYEDEQDK